MMLDQHDSRLRIDQGPTLSAWLGALKGQIFAASEAMVRIRYAAPWEGTCGAALGRVDGVDPIARRGC